MAHFFKKKIFLIWANPGIFLVYFRLFKQTIHFLQQINVEKHPSSRYMATGFKPTTFGSLLPLPLDQGSRPQKDLKKVFRIGPNTVVDCYKTYV